MQKYLRWAGIAFVAFYLYTDPNGAASFVRGVFAGLQGAGDSLATFVNGLS